MHKTPNSTPQDEDTDYLFETVPLEMFQTLTQSQMIQYIHGQQDMIKQLIRINVDCTPYLEGFPGKLRTA